MSSIYDAIADIYDADMGANMRLPDVEYYTRLAATGGEPVLELGCGNGRVLAALLAARLDAIGLDRSHGMLAAARARLSAPASLVQMDIRALGLRSHFKVVLLPYSLVTYLLTEQDWRALGSGLRGALAPGARIVVDAFVPDPTVAHGHWIRDYARKLGDRCLVRHKRVTVLLDGCHRIERRYRLAGSWAGRTLITKDVIRPYSPDQLLAQARRYLGEIEHVDYDYGTRPTLTGASFVSIQVRAPAT